MLNTDKDSDEDEPSDEPTAAKGGTETACLPLNGDRPLATLQPWYVALPNCPTTAEPTTSPINTSLLSCGATWVCETARQTLAAPTLHFSCLALRFLHVNKQEAFGLVKLAVLRAGEPTEMTTLHEFFSAELSPGPACLRQINAQSAPASPRGQSTQLTLQLEQGRLDLTFDPYLSFEKDHRRNKTVAPSRLVFSPPPSPKLPLLQSLPSSCSQRRTYAAVVKGLKVLDRQAHPDGVCYEHMPSYDRELWNAGQHRDHPITPLNADQSLLSSTLQQQQHEHAYAPPHPRRRFVRGRSQRRTFTASSSNADPLFGHAPFSTALTQARMSGTFCLNDGQKAGVELKFIGTTSTEEFISSASRPQLDLASSSSAFGEAFKPSHRKQAGYLESSCEYTLV